MDALWDRLGSGHFVLDGEHVQIMKVSGPRMPKLSQWEALLGQVPIGQTSLRHTIKEMMTQRSKESVRVLPAKRNQRGWRSRK